MIRVPLSTEKAPKATRSAIFFMLMLAFCVVFSILSLEHLQSILNSVMEPLATMVDNNTHTHSKIETEKEIEKDERLLPKSLLDEIRAYRNISVEERPRPPKTPGAFLHVGKAGGSTLCQVHAYSFHSFVLKGKKPNTINGTAIENYFGTLTTYIHTPDFQKWEASMQQNTNPTYYPDYSFYVANLRDPLSKLLSTLTYMHPANGFDGVKSRSTRNACKAYFQCFPTVESFSEHLGDDPLNFNYPFEPTENPFGKNATTCRDLARASMANKVQFCVDHLLWNTKGILEGIPGWKNGPDTSANSTLNGGKPRSFFAIRSEHMDRDFLDVNKILGDPHPVLLKDLGTPRLRVQSANKAVTKAITDQGRSRLCQALLPEYKAYFLALSRAINLTPRDRQVSLELSRSNCPTLDWLQSHSDFI